jgi:hypothetical protein
MAEWSAGYVSDIDYTYGYYPELNPLRAEFALTHAGLVAPEIHNACELGFGQGLGANIHAAASPIHWYGTDFNPSQAGFAQDAAAACGSGARLFDESFADFANRSDLPEFDFIGLHGIWSWISATNRETIAHFIRKRLKVGGVVYISYNTQPGWASFEPMRDLMAYHAETMSAQGSGTAQRIGGALDFAERLVAAKAGYLRAHPQVAERLKTMRSQSRQYLAHEYFNRDWHPMHIAEVARCLEPAKVSYACSAHFVDHLPAINLLPEQQSLLQEIGDPIFREYVRDFLTNQKFRRDYWVKGPRKLHTLQRNEALRSLRVVLTSHAADIPMKVIGVLGEVALPETIYRPLIELLADFRPKSIGQLEDALKAHGQTSAQVRESIVALCGTGHLAPAQSDKDVARIKSTTAKLNHFLIERARDSTDISKIASPLTGGGFSLPRVDQLFMLAVGQGKKTPDDLAQFAWSILDSQGHKIVKDGRPLESAQENQAELRARATAFVERHLGLLRGHQII